MLTSNVPRPTSLALLQCEHGARSTGALSTLHFLGRVRRRHGRRRLRGLVFGSGDDVSPTVGARSSAGAHSTARLLRRWWRNRCRRSGHLRRLLLRWHVDDDADVARVETGSDAHDLDAPLPGAPKMSGLSAASSTYGALGAPSGSARERGPRAEQIEVERAGETGDFYPASGLSGEIKPLLLLCVCIRSCSRARAYGGVGSTNGGTLVWESSEPPNPFYVRMGLPFIV